jgi:hypothetical protein
MTKESSSDPFHRSQGKEWSREVKGSDRVIQGTPPVVRVLCRPTAVRDIDLLSCGEKGFGG